MNKQNKPSTSIFREDWDALGALDKFFVLMSSGYLVTWFVSIPFFRTYWDDPSHGGFFDQIGVVAFIYTVLAGVNFCSKVTGFGKISHYLWAVTYALFGFFLAFPLGGFVGACIVSAVVAFVAYKKAWDTSFVTGGLLGYWLMLLIVSAFEYNPFLKTEEGFMAMVFEFLAACINMADYGVHQMTLSWFIFVPLGMGYFFHRTFGAVVTEKQEEKEEQTEKQTEKTSEPVQPTPQAPPVVVMESVAPVAPVEPVVVNQSKRRGQEKPSKGFFHISSPTTKVKLKKWSEQILRNLSK